MVGQEGINLPRDHASGQADIVEQTLANGVDGGVLVVETLHEEGSEDGRWWR
jgi:hypothetical protein